MTRFVGLDPSTHTGLVILGYDGHLLDSMEITAAGKDPGRMMEITDSVMEQLEPNDIIAIEGFSFGSKGAGVSVQYGIGWGIRFALVERGYEYIEVPPTSLKKFTGAAGNAGKEVVAVAAYKRWGFESNNNNITDAFVLAQIAKGVRFPDGLIKAQVEVIQAIRNPPEKKKRKAKKNEG